MPAIRLSPADEIDEAISICILIVAAVLLVLAKHIICHPLNRGTGLLLEHITSLHASCVIFRRLKRNFCLLLFNWML